MEFEPLFNTPREHCPLSEERLIEAANTGMLPLADRNGVKIVVAPGLADSRRLVAVAISAASWQAAFGSPVPPGCEILWHATALRKSNAEQLTRCAADIPNCRPAQPSASRSDADVSGAGRARGIRGPQRGAGFSRAFRGRRVPCLDRAAAVRPVQRALHARRPRTFSDGRLPTYSIVIALYGKAAAVPDLVTALRALNSRSRSWISNSCSSRTTA